MQHFKSRRSFLSGAAVVAAMCTPLFGCSDSLTAGSTSSLSMQLTDAPGDVQHAFVTISKIYLQGSGADTSSVVLMSTPVTVDLTTLADGNTSQLFRNVSIPTGTYSQLRFVVDGGYIAVANSSNTGLDYYVTSSGAPTPPAGANVVGTLQCPSCGQSGIKVNLPNNTISVSGQQTLLVDFNVGESFGHRAGASGRWIMRPVVKATSVATSATVTATLQAGIGVTLPKVVSGTDTVDFTGFSAVLTPASGTPDTVNFSSTTTTGVYAATFPYLVPGTYTVDILSPTGVTAFVTTPTAPQTVTVGSGATSTTAFTLTSVTP